MFNFTPIDMSTEKIYTYMLKKCENNFLSGAYICKLHAGVFLYFDAV